MVQSTPGRSSSMAEKLMAKLAAGEFTVSSFKGTGLHAKGGQSACGLASMNAVALILDHERQGTAPLDLLGMLLKRSFHAEIVEVSAHVSGSDDPDVDNLLKLPLFARTLSLISRDFLACSADSLSNLFSQLEGEARSTTSCTATILTRAPEVVSVICIPTGHTLPNANSIFIVFDAHEREAAHPNGAAFLFFPDIDKAAAYVYSLFYTVPTASPQSGEPSESPVKFSSHMVAVSSVSVLSEINGALLEGSQRSLLYESSADLIQVRSQISTLERDLVNLQHKHTELLSNANKPVELPFSRPRPLGPRPSMSVKSTTEANAPGTSSRRSTEDPSLSRNHSIDYGAQALSHRPDPSLDPFADPADIYSDSANYEIPQSGASPAAQIEVTGSHNNVVSPNQFAVLDRSNSTNIDDDGVPPSFHTYDPRDHHFDLHAIEDEHPTAVLIHEEPGARVYMDYVAYPHDFHDDLFRRHARALRGTEVPIEVGQQQGSSVVSKVTNTVKSLIRPVQGVSWTANANAAGPSSSSTERDLPKTPTSSHDNGGGGFFSSAATKLLNFVAPVDHVQEYHNVPRRQRNARSSSNQQRHRRENDDEALSAAIAMQLHMQDQEELPRATGAAPQHPTGHQEEEWEDLVAFEDQVTPRALNVALQPEDEFIYPEQPDIEVDHSPSRSAHRPPPIARSLPPQQPLSDFDSIYGVADTDFESDRDLALRFAQEEEHNMARGPPEPESEPEPSYEDDLDVARDREMALRFAHEEEENDRATEALLASFSQQVIFNCSVCMEENPLDDVAVVEPCQHQFCRACLRQYIVTRLGEGNFPIPCPTCGSDKKVERPGEISSQLAEQLGISEREYEQWNKFDLARFSVAIECPHCKKSSLIDREDYQHESTQVLTCPVSNCRKQWCKRCNQKVSGEHSCDGTKEMDRFIQRSGFRRCPGCNTPIERTAGCDHMTCRVPGCRTEFSYSTGRRMR